MMRRNKVNITGKNEATESSTVNIKSQFEQEVLKGCEGFCLAHLVFSLFLSLICVLVPVCATVLSCVGGPRGPVRLLLFSPVLDWLELAES